MVVDVNILNAIGLKNNQLNQGVNSESAVSEALPEFLLGSGDGNEELPVSDFFAQFLLLYPELAQTIREQLQANGKITLDEGALQKLLPQLSLNKQKQAIMPSDLLAKVTTALPQQAGALAEGLTKPLPIVQENFNANILNLAGSSSNGNLTDEIPQLSMLLKSFQMEPELKQQFNHMLNTIAAGNEGSTISNNAVTHLAGLQHSALNFAGTTAQHTAIQTPMTATELSVNPPVQSVNWGDALSERIVWLSTQQIKTASLKLNPPELGPLEVSIKLNQEQPSVHFSSQHAVVRDAIEQALPRLREMFAQTGMNLADANVSDQALFKQQHDGATNAGNGNGQMNMSADTESVQPTMNTVVAMGNQLIDYYA